MQNQLDKDGYILIPEIFQEHGFTIKFIEDLGDNFRIYSRQKPGVSKYELVKIRNQEQYEIAGNIIPKKQKYPSTKEFGFFGWEFNHIEAARAKHKELISRQQEKIDSGDKRLKGNYRK